MTWTEIRAQFPALNNWTYLNTATFGQTPLRSQAAVAGHFARRDELACSDFLSWFDDMDEARALLGRLINCEAEDVAFCNNDDYVDAALRVRIARSVARGWRGLAAGFGAIQASSKAPMAGRAGATT